MPSSKIDAIYSKNEAEEYFDQYQKTKADSSATIGNEDGTISQEPKATQDMQLDVPQKKERNNNSDDDDDDDDSSDVTSATISEQGSGYERNSNECTECAIDLIGCFGLFDSCCPSTGEGFHHQSRGILWSSLLDVVNVSIIDTYFNYIPIPYTPTGDSVLSVTRWLIVN